MKTKTKLGRWEGNTFHNHGRFGTYTLGSNYPKITDQSISTNGYNTDKSLCDGFDVASGGVDHGIPAAIVNNFDYGNAFVGHYNAGEIQYRNHISIDNNNLIYWKETKNFANGCSAHMTGGYYAEGNMALPDQGTFIIEETTFGEGAKLEANHHCNVGTTGVLCMPQYVLHNVKWKNRNSGKWIWFQNHNTQGHNANQNHGGVFTLSPASIVAIVSGQINKDEIFFPPGYVSLVSSKFTYLLSLPNNVCTLSSTTYGTRYDGGILCKVPLRALKIYSRNLTSGSAPSLHVDVWANSLGVNGQTGNADASQDVNFHQIGGDGRTRKQGFSLPVIPGTTYSYHLSLNTGDRAIPDSWVIEFSDPVMGNRWAPEQLQLAVQGRNCGADGLVSSQHDRRFLWSGDEFIDNSAWGSHGACVNSLSPPPDMPLKDCSSTEGVIEATECPDLCPITCDSMNSFCHCGTATCQCKPGFGGVDCSVDLCAAARCSDEHGKCAARYLGSSSVLPITNSDSACICDVGWSGPLCDSNPCAEQGRTCSGHGTCQAISEKETICSCDEGYSGENCETTCTGFCQGNGGVYPYGCASSLDGVVAYSCGSEGGCSYQTDPTATPPNGFCTYKNKAPTDSTCDCPNDNDCMIAGTCRDDGTCPDTIARSDGTPCNSVPFGICQAGVCTAPPTPPPTDEPTQSPTVTSRPTKTPTTIPPTKSPTDSPTQAPVVVVDPYEMKDCTGICPGSYPFGCADNLPGKVSYRCHPNGGCDYADSLDEPFLWSGFCVYKTVTPSTPAPTKLPTQVPVVVEDPYAMKDCTGICPGSYPFGCADNLPGKVSYRCGSGGGCHYGDSHDTPYPSDFCVFKTVAPPTLAPTKPPTQAPVVAVDPYEMTDCTGICPGSYPFGCADNLLGKVSYRCHPNGGCDYADSLDEQFPFSGFCVFKTIAG